MAAFHSTASSAGALACRRLLRQPDSRRILAFAIVTPSSVASSSISSLVAPSGRSLFHSTPTRRLRDPLQAEREANTVSGNRLARDRAEKLNQSKKEKGHQGASDGPGGNGNGGNKEQSSTEGECESTQGESLSSSSSQHAHFTFLPCPVQRG